jgi:hypothetical protein
MAVDAIRNELQMPNAHEEVPLQPIVSGNPFAPIETPKMLDIIEGNA